MDNSRAKVSSGPWASALCVVAATATLCAVVSGCKDDLMIGPGHSDFSAPLTGGYVLWHTSAHDVFVESNTSDASAPRIPTKVVELGYDDAFIIARQHPLRRRSPNNLQDTYQEPDLGVVQYWILNVQTPQVWGPLDEAAFLRKRSELGVAPGLTMRDVDSYRPSP